MALVNTYPYVLLTRTLLPQMKDDRVLLLSVASLISFIPSCFDAVYAASKAFEVAFLEALRRETSPNIDFLTMCPQYVSTNNARLHPGGLVATTEQFTNATMRAVGRTQMSCGTWKHEVFCFVLKGIEAAGRRWNLH